jgi:ATP-dependent protease ClpP protease subunit
MSRPWFQVTALAERKAEIALRGVIGMPKFYAEYGFNAAGTARDFEKELKALGQVDEITLRIYSPGGYVFDALAIHDILASHPARITAVVDGLAASAATIVLMAADRVSMPSNAYLMIHNAQGCECGDHRALGKMAQDLEKYSGDIAKLYVGKIRALKGNATKKTLTELRTLMDAETWLSGSEAHALGLVDEVTNEVALSACLTPLDLATRLPVNLDRVPEAVRGAFDTVAPTTPSEPDNPAMKIRTPLLAPATDAPPAGGTPTPPPAAAPIATAPPPAPVPPAAPPAAPTASAPTPTPPPAPVPAPTGLTLDDVRNAVGEAIAPLTQRLTALEGLRGAGVSPTAWGGQPPVDQPAGNLDAPKTEAEVRDRLSKAKNFTERREILNQARAAGLKV